MGAEADDLPGFIVLTSKGGGQSQPIAARQWHNGFLPSRFQGVQFNSSGDPVHYVRNPRGVGNLQQREIIDDELGYYAVEDIVHIRDFHATMLHLLGIDHKRFKYPFQGLDMGLTGVEPSRVVHEILA